MDKENYCLECIELKESIRSLEAEIDKLRAMKAKCKKELNKVYRKICNDESIHKDLISNMLNQHPILIGCYLIGAKLDYEFNKENKYSVNHCILFERNFEGDEVKLFPTYSKSYSERNITGFTIYNKKTKEIILTANYSDIVSTFNYLYKEGYTLYYDIVDETNTYSMTSTLILHRYTFNNDDVFQINYNDKKIKPDKILKTFEKTYSIELK